jgi:hypothetical protein
MEIKRTPRKAVPMIPFHLRLVGKKDKFFRREASRDCSRVSCSNLDAFSQLGIVNVVPARVREVRRNNGLAERLEGRVSSSHVVVIAWSSARASTEEPFCPRSDDSHVSRHRLSWLQDQGT